MFCSAVVLSTTACGIRVSSTDFPVFRLAEPDAVAKPVAEVVPARTPAN
jgi:hypothetical protein